MRAAPVVTALLDIARTNPIGRAVNEISRMEMLCDRIGRSIVLSEIFAQRCSRPTVALGAFALRGIAGDHVLYAVR